MKESGPRVYLLDVEGTVAPISFVYEQLFPYARAHFEEFLQCNVAHLPEDFLGYLNQLIVENLSEQDPDAPKILPVFDSKTVSANPSAFVQGALAYIFWLMD